LSWLLAVHPTTTGLSNRYALPPKADVLNAYAQVLQNDGYTSLKSRPTSQYS